MSTMAATRQGRRPRRQFDDDFQAQVVHLVLDEGKTVGAAAPDLDLTPSVLRRWVEQARADRTTETHGLDDCGTGGTGAASPGGRELRVERDILKTAAAFFAKHQSYSLPGSLRR